MNSLTSGKTKTRPTKKPCLPLKDVKALFERFSSIWGGEWNKRYENNVAGALREWAEALAAFNAQQIDRAIEIARIKHTWAPKISEFEILCHNASDGAFFKFSDALEIAERKLRKKLLPKSYDDFILERDLIAALTLKIYKAQDDNADIVFCAAQDCKKHIFVAVGGDAQWFCDGHKGN